MRDKKRIEALESKQLNVENWSKNIMAELADVKNSIDSIDKYNHKNKWVKYNTPKFKKGDETNKGRVIESFIDKKPHPFGNISYYWHYKVIKDDNLFTVKESDLKLDNPTHLEKVAEKTGYSLDKAHEEEMYASNVALGDERARVELLENENRILKESKHPTIEAELKSKVLRGLKLLLTVCNDDDVDDMVVVINEFEKL